MRILNYTSTCTSRGALLNAILFAGVFLFAALGSTFDVCAQRYKAPLAQSAVYAELGGPGILYSLNYDYRFREDASLRIGISAFPSDDNIIFSVGWVLFPASLNYLMFEGNHHIELSIGAMPGTINGSFFGSERVSALTVIGIANVGYRYQPRGGGAVFRVGLTPLFTFSGMFAVTAGFSGGVAF